MTLTAHRAVRPAARRSGVRRLVGRALIHLVLGGGALLMLTPFFWLVSSSLKSPAEIYVFPPV
ncbi:MAG: hypothetical protein IRY83_01950, partial [Chloroflexi bacterium]|nr:hypothetical protein [Chloroflexota bacterium]